MQTWAGPPRELIQEEEEEDNGVFSLQCFVLSGDTPMQNQAVPGERGGINRGPESINNHDRASTEPNDFACGKK